MQPPANYQVNPATQLFFVVYCFDPKRKNNLYKLRTPKYSYTQKYVPHTRQSRSYKTTVHPGWNFGR